MTTAVHGCSCHLLAFHIVHSRVRPAVKEGCLPWTPAPCVWSTSLLRRSRAIASHTAFAEAPSRHRMSPVRGRPANLWRFG